MEVAMEVCGVLVTLSGLALGNSFKVPQRLAILVSGGLFVGSLAYLFSTLH